MTLDDLRQMDTEVLTPAVVGKVLHCDPYAISLQARDCPAALGFPVIRTGTRTRIPRLAFIRFLEGVGDDEA